MDEGFKNVFIWAQLCYYFDRLLRRTACTSVIPCSILEVSLFYATIKVVLAL
jgi:hypothetical protein